MVTIFTSASSLFQPQQMRLAAAALFGGLDFGQQPLLQSGGVVVLLVFFGELFQKLVVIGEAAAVAAGEQARFDAVARGKLLHGGIKAVLLPLQGGGLGRMYPLEQRLASS